MANLYEIEVAYAGTTQQKVIKLQVEPGCTVLAAIKQSGILEQFAEIDLAQNPVGVFSKKVSLEKLVAAGDRIEIYRPLLIDPMQARRIRAKKVG
jgi:putative ubiquitin-RnfH superfamily antitoxin RatB of RatAB toxin-antitoxin module